MLVNERSIEENPEKLMKKKKISSTKEKESREIPLHGNIPRMIRNFFAICVYIHDYKTNTLKQG